MLTRVVGLCAALALLGAGCAAPGQQAAATPADATVRMHDGRFDPAELTIHVGENVEWRNDDSVLHWPASNPHPTHTGLPGLDALGELRTGETYRFTFEKVGTFGFHDHAVARLGRGGYATGTVTVVP